jgi:ABC-type nitrate/sulfonate/bicarbonate transport system substrate-binding protein
MSWRLRIPAAVAVLTLLAACGAGPGASPSAQSTQAAGGSGSPAAEAIAFKQGFIPGLNHLPEVLAQTQAGDFGLALETVNFTTVPDTITALVRGDIDIMINTPSTAISGRDQGIPLVVVGGGYHRGTSLVLASDLNVAKGDWAALKAAVAKAKTDGTPLKLGAAASVSTNWIECYYTLKAQGIDPEKDLEVVNIPAFSEHPGALGRGDVDMLCTSEPFATLAQVQGGGVWFAYPFDTPAGESLGALVTTEKILADPQKKEGIKRYLTLYDHVAEMITGDKTLAVTTAKTVMKTTDTDVAERALNATKFDVGFNKQQFAELARMHFEIGQTNKDWSGEVDTWTDDEFVKGLSDMNK